MVDSGGQDMEEVFTPGRKGRLPVIGALISGGKPAEGPPHCPFAVVKIESVLEVRYNLGYLISF